MDREDVEKLIRSPAFQQRVRVHNGCWEWTGALVNRKPVITIDGEMRRVRPLLHPDFVLHKTMVVPVCATDLCVHPHHMIVLTMQAAGKRFGWHRARTDGTGPGVHNRRKTHCPQGHPYTPDNTYQTQGRVDRICKICARARAARRYRARKAKAHVAS